MARRDDDEVGEVLPPCRMLSMCAHRTCLLLSLCLSSVSLTEAQVSDFSGILRRRITFTEGNLFPLAGFLLTKDNDH